MVRRQLPTIMHLDSQPYCDWMCIGSAFDLRRANHRAKHSILDVVLADKSSSRSGFGASNHLS